MREIIREIFEEHGILKPLAVVSIFLVLVTFALFMLARRIPDERLAGASGLAPVVFVFATFWLWIVLKLIRRK